MAVKPCKAFPGHQKFDEEVRQWCLRNRHTKMCSECEEFPANGPEVSIYQKEKKNAEPM